MSVRFLFAPVLMASFLFGDDELSLAALGSETFAVREQAESEVKEWASRNPATAKERLLKVYLGSEDPEVRRRLIPALERAYFPPKGYVGIQMMPARFDQFGRLRRLGGDQEFDGVVVTAVVPGSAAAKSGLKVGDVILKINEWDAEGETDITAAVAREIQKNPPRSEVSLGVRRGEKSLNVVLKLGVLPVPSERARLMKTSSVAGGGMVTDELVAQMEEFRQWLLSEIERDRKNLIADRRL